MSADESAGDAVIGIERAEGCSEFEVFEAVGGADGDAPVFDIRIFERAFGCFHVAHVAGGNFTFERNAVNVGICADNGCESRLACFGVVRDVAMEKRIVKGNVLMIDLNDTACDGERLCENLRSARDVQFVCGQGFGCDRVIGRGGAHVSAKGTVFGKRDVTA